ncbi:glycosyltransferase family 2 protein [Neobacillus sp. PS3-12]|uniref:glycosyltransferase family 2 protein n=1 Tax=Neobacillus sp. PS3-12 TaxID=3070677 RepID=UPI0027DF2C29|nr:glycosyltransferase family 2 protein [Neobacillus sp. PS3-12]WML51597.1 glycosyltransferase family 2 protein [Neobacillus sp. PS3-12]
MNKVVSIVVPIYRVEKYLRRCLQSILQQTYKQLEIILVDDGSPDDCGKMAEEFARKDNRIKVFHKENGGLSDARNYGMKYVTGDYTIFVDSDDWLAANMVEQMMNVSEEYQADIVQTAFYYAYDEYLLFDNRYYAKDDYPIVLDQTLMCELVKNEKVKNFAWGKLYKTSIIRNIPFRKGVLFEDVFWAHTVMHKVNKLVLLTQPLYYYFQRSDSIVATYTPRNLDILKGLKERHQFIETFYKELVNESYRVILETSLIHYNLLLLNRKQDLDGKYKREIWKYINKNYQNLKMAVESEHSLRNQLTLFTIHPSLNIGYLFLKKILRKFYIVPRPIGLEKVDYRAKSDF